MDSPVGGIPPKIPEFSIQDVDSTLEGVEISGTDAKVVKQALLSGLGRVIKEDIEAAKGTEGSIRIKVKKPNFFQKLVALFVRKVLRRDYPLSTRVTVIGPKGKKHTTPIPEQHLRKMQILAYQKTYHDESQSMSLALRDFKDFTRRVGKNLLALGGEESVREVQKAKAFLKETIEKDYTDAAKPGYLKELSKIYQKGMEKLVGKMPMTVLKEVSFSKGYDELAAILKEVPKSRLGRKDVINLLEMGRKTHEKEVKGALKTFSKRVAEILNDIPPSHDPKEWLIYIKPNREKTLNKALRQLDKSYQKYQKFVGEVLSRYGVRKLSQKTSEVEVTVEYLELQRQKYLENPYWGASREEIIDWMGPLDSVETPEMKGILAIQEKKYRKKIEDKQKKFQKMAKAERLKLPRLRSEEPVISPEEFREFAQFLSDYTKMFPKEIVQIDAESLLSDLRDSIKGSRPLGAGEGQASYDDDSARDYQDAIDKVFRDFQPLLR